MSRQAAHTIVVAAARRELVRLESNPHDRRLIQIELTRQGLGELAAADVLERRWAITLLNGLDTHRMRATSHILRTIRQRLKRVRQ
jgi:DNA-binding MarR family transcriptional regulator